MTVQSPNRKTKQFKGPTEINGHSSCFRECNAAICLARGWGLLVQYQVNIYDSDKTENCLKPPPYTLFFPCSQTHAKKTSCISSFQFLCVLMAFFIFFFCACVVFNVEVLQRSLRKKQINAIFIECCVFFFNMSLTLETLPKSTNNQNVVYVDLRIFYYRR